jgi:hypothetical protein
MITAVRYELKGNLRHQVGCGSTPASKNKLLDDSGRILPELSVQANLARLWWPRTADLTAAAMVAANPGSSASPLNDERLPDWAASTRLSPGMP